MIVQIDGLNLLPGSGELLSQCVDDLDDDERVVCETSWQEILQSLWKLSQDKGDEIRSGIENLMQQRRLEGTNPEYFWEAREIDWTDINDIIGLPLDAEGLFNTTGDCRFVDESELLSWLWLFAALSVPGTRILGVGEEVNTSIDLCVNYPYVDSHVCAVRRNSRTEFEELPCRILDTVQDGEMSIPLKEWIGEPVPGRVEYITGDSSPVSGRHGWVDEHACVGQRVTVFPAKLLKSPVFADRLNAALIEAYAHFERVEDAFPWHLQVVDGQLVLADPDSLRGRHAESLGEDREQAEQYGVALPADTMSATPLGDEDMLWLARMVGDALDIGGRALVQMEGMVSHDGSDETDYSITGLIYPVEHRADGVHVLEACRQEVQVYDGGSWIPGKEWMKNAQTRNRADGDGR
jgi:hypothetical protein